MMLAIGIGFPKDFYAAVTRWQSLTEMDDHILRDIGVSRGDVEGLKHLPLGQNAVHALEELARLRRWGV